MIVSSGGITFIEETFNIQQLGIRQWREDTEKTN